MNLIHIDRDPIGTFPYMNAGPRHDLNEDGSNKQIERILPVLKGLFQANTRNIDAMIIASDLQGNVDCDGQTCLVGEKLAGYLKLLIGSEFNISSHRTGVILAGDLYAPIDRRGGHGDVRKVYTSFRDAFRWVVGVNGNHDKIGLYKLDEPRFRKEKNITILHKETTVIDDLKISGISGIIALLNKSPRTSPSLKTKPHPANKPDGILQADFYTYNVLPLAVIYRGYF